MALLDFAVVIAYAIYGLFLMVRGKDCTLTGFLPKNINICQNVTKFYGRGLQLT